MEIDQPNTTPPSLKELQDLEKLKAIIEHATADGKLTEAELQTIKTAIQKDRKISPQELNLVQKLIYEKLQRGDLEMSW